MNLNITGSYTPYSYGTNSGNAKALKDRSGSQPESRHIGTTDRDFSDRIRIQKEQYENETSDTGKNVNAKPDYLPYAGNHVVNNKNEYFAMAKDDMIIYQGIVFTCDRLTDTLTLGDVSDPDRCVRVGLTKGGSLLFNRDNASTL